MTKKPKEKFAITFKQERETGLAAVGNPYPTVHIKVNKKEVGIIYPPNWRSEERIWKINLAIAVKPQEDQPSDFRWHSVKKKFESEEAAREWIKENLANVHKNNPLHFFED